MPQAFEIERIEADAAAPAPGSTLEPIARFEARGAAGTLASVVFGRAEIFEREPPEYALARLTGAESQPEAARAVLAAAAAQQPAGSRVYFPVSAAQKDHAARRAIAEACGFELFQEKEGYWWADHGRPLPEDASLRLQSMARLGPEPFVPLVAACLARTLDRTDALVYGRHDPHAWVRTFLDAHAGPEDRESWFAAETADAVPIGFVGLARAEAEPQRATLVLIGVLPQHRGQRHVDRLIQAAYRSARARGFVGVLSHVDVDNRPMTAAMLRTGADAHTHPWHKWTYVRSVK